MSHRPPIRTSSKSPSSTASRWTRSRYSPAPTPCALRHGASCVSTAARARGAAGALMDGCVRDTKAIWAMGFPVFHGGVAPLGHEGPRQDHGDRCPHRGRQVPVETGDLVFGDADGVVIVPAKVEEEVIGLALEKVAGEGETLRALQRGEKLATSRPLRNSLTERAAAPGTKPASGPMVGNGRLVALGAPTNVRPARDAREAYMTSCSTRTSHHIC